GPDADGWSNIQWNRTWVEEEVDWWSFVGDPRESRRKDEEMRVVNRRGVVSGGGVVFGVASSTLGKNPSGARGVCVSKFICSQVKEKRRNDEEIKFYATMKNPESRLKIRSISRVQELTIRSSKSQE
ncbi:hypothetical protein Tco_1453818, partial [Tanacetum coccineum]